MLSYNETRFASGHLPEGLDVPAGEVAEWLKAAVC